MSSRGNNRNGAHSGKLDGIRHHEQCHSAELQCGEANSGPKATWQRPALRGKHQPLHRRDPLHEILSKFKRSLRFSTCSDHQEVAFCTRNIVVFNKEPSARVSFPPVNTTTCYCMMEVTRTTTLRVSFLGS